MPPTLPGWTTWLITSKNFHWRFLAMLAYPGELVSINSTFGYADEDEGELYIKE